MYIAKIAKLMVRMVTTVVKKITMDFNIMVVLRSEKKVFYVSIYYCKGREGLTVPGFPNPPCVAGQVGNYILQDLFKVFIHLKI